MNLSPVVAYLKEEKEKIVFLKQLSQRYLLPLTLIVLIMVSLVYLTQDTKNNSNFLRRPLGWGLNQDGAASATFFKENNLSGPIFNNYDLGSALIFWLYPSEKVFVDNRPEAYNKKFFSDVYKPMQENEEDWLKYSQEYKINLIYFSHTDFTPWARKFLYRRLSDPNWRLIYFDQHVVIMLKNDEGNQKLIKKLGINSQEFRKQLRELVDKSSLKEKFYLANLAELASDSELAEEIYHGILFKNPYNRRALYALGNLYVGTSDRTILRQSVKYLQRAIEAGYNLPGAYNQIGLAYWRLQEYEQAETAWKKTLRIDRGNKTAKNYLKQIKQFKMRGVLPKTGKSL